MSENSKIEWCDHTFNPWIGCTRISPACDHCYAARIDHRFGGGHWGAGAPRKRTSASNWKQPLRWNRQAEAEGVRYRVFCASLADVFDNEVPIEWRVDLFDLIRRTPNLDWLLLTKRIGNVEKMLNEAADLAYKTIALRPLAEWIDQWLSGKAPPATVWLGVTVINQAEADRDVPKLISTPAAVRFLSIEPMLGPIDLTRLPSKCSNEPGECCGGPLTMNVLEGSDNCPGCEGPEEWVGGLDWIIAGGESGPQARPSHPQWFRSLRDQCVEAGVPFLFKQWGEWVPLKQRCLEDFKIDGITPTVKVCRLGHGLETYRVGKNTAGRRLDGRTWDQFPRGRQT